MKTSKVWVTAGFLLSSLITGIANAQNTNFILANKTAFALHSVYVWPSGSDDLGPDWLGDYILRSGQSLRVEPTSGGCMYNIGVILEDDGSKMQLSNINLCNTSTVTLNYDDQSGDLWASRK